MLVDSSNSATGLSAVTGAIREASEATGTSFNYLLATAQVESGFNALAGAATSSARGLFQFIQQTWLATMKQSGPDLGYGQYADAITQTPSGQYQVADPAMRTEILKLRDDPAANAAMAGAFTQANAAVLSERLGRTPTEGELYIAHMLGTGGALRLIELSATNPNASAADAFGGAAKANASIFYDRNGVSRSVAQVRQIITARYDSARGVQRQGVSTHSGSGRLITAPSAGDMHPASAADQASAVPDTAGITSAFASAVPQRAASDTQVFHALFADGARTAAVAPVVTALWASPGAPATPGNAAAAQKPANAGWGDLFKDSGQDS